LILYSAVGTTVAGGGEKAKPNHKIIGLVLPGRQSGRAFLVRILGPREEVDTARKDFTAMIERAVQEATE
jgi:hypothetical protein